MLLLAPISLKGLPSPDSGSQRASSSARIELHLENGESGPGDSSVVEYVPSMWQSSGFNPQQRGRGGDEGSRIPVERERDHKTNQRQKVGANLEGFPLYLLAPNGGRHCCWQQFPAPQPPWVGLFSCLQAALAVGEVDSAPRPHPTPSFSLFSLSFQIHKQE